MVGPGPEQQVRSDTIRVRSESFITSHRTDLRSLIACVRTQSDRGQGVSNMNEKAPWSAQGTTAKPRSLGGGATVLGAVAVAAIGRL